LSKTNPNVKNLKDLAKLEEDYAVKLDKDVRGYGNDVLQQIIDSVAIDSTKHAGLYKACAAILEGTSLSITDVEFEQLQKSLNEHINVETKMIKSVETMLLQIKDPRIRMVLNHIRDDEYRHHTLLKNFDKLVVKKELILESDVWNMLFRDALTHGHAPPGPYEIDSIFQEQE